MTDGQVIKRAKYKLSTKDPGTPGVLTMKRERFVFMPSDPRSSTTLNVEFRLIIGHKFTKEVRGSKPLLNLTQDKGGSYIFEFDSFSDRDACREFVVLQLETGSVIRPSIQGIKINLTGCGYFGESKCYSPGRSKLQGQKTCIKESYDQTSLQL